MLPDPSLNDQAAGLRRGQMRSELIIVLGAETMPGGIVLALVQACTQVWGSVLVADPGAFCLAEAGVQPLFSGVEERALMAAAGCKFVRPGKASLIDLERFATQTGNRALLYVTGGDSVEPPPPGTECKFVVLGHDSAPDRSYAWLKCLAQNALLPRAWVLWYGHEAGYLRLAETSQRFLSYKITGEISLPGFDPACAARALAARMRDGGQPVSWVRLHA